jgi:hypothetical protein
MTGSRRRQNRERPLALVPTCRSSELFNAKVRHRSSAASKVSCTPSELLIGNGAEIEGSVIAQEVTICGRVKGTIRALRVKLQDGGAVEGDIFHRSLSIDENSLFEGSSRRVEHLTEPSSVDTNSPQKRDGQSSALSPYLHRVDGSPSSESAIGPKH